ALSCDLEGGRAILVGTLNDDLVGGCAILEGA
ncbi:hypothetical protein A2U01_0001881, partial [Trifolium medium]|nr:hypothetical protein [Trifolium medium]